MSSILIGICTYNEIENLPQLLQQIEEVMPEADILVVDDGSPDGTGEWVVEQAAKRSGLFCIQRQGKLGLGTATIATLKFAIEREYQFVFNLDADLSHPPAALPRLLAAAQGKSLSPEGHSSNEVATMSDHTADVAVGSRYIPGGKIIGWPLRRRLMSRGVNWLARLLLRLPTQDCSGSFRCYRVSKLRQVPLDRIRSTGYSFFEEILWQLRHVDAKFVEVPITFQDRLRGQSKINLREAVRALRIIATLAISRP